MRSFLILILLLFGYIAFVIPFSGHMKDRPVAVKLGYIPNAEITRMVAPDFRFLLSELNVIKVLFYFGTLTDQLAENVLGRPEYASMYYQLVQSAKLDPYNQDVYYFSQAIFTWDLGRVEEVNKLLDYGMRFNQNDWRLPYYAGFNSAYFLKDYESAARYFKRAAEISGNELFTKLAARYFHEAGQGQLGILFLETMIKGAKNPSVKETYILRKKALEAALFLKNAVADYQLKYAKRPRNLNELVKMGFIKEIPNDPYGGSFSLNENGEIETTSKFSPSLIELEPEGLNEAK